MATKFYLRSEVAEIDPAAEDERLASLTPGSSLTVATKSTITGPVTAATQLMTPTAGGTFMIWISPKLDAVTISGTITANLWMAESAAQANAQVQAIVAEIDETGTWINQINLVSSKGAELPTPTRAAQNWAITPISTAFTAGHRLVFNVYIDDAPAVTMASGRTVTLGYAGGTAGVDGDSWFEFTETITLLSLYQPRYGFVDHTNFGVF